MRIQRRMFGQTVTVTRKTVTEARKARMLKERKKKVKWKGIMKASVM